MPRIAIARTPEEIDACFPVMSQLRPKNLRKRMMQEAYYFSMSVAGAH